MQRCFTCTPPNLSGQKCYRKYMGEKWEIVFVNLLPLGIIMIRGYYMGSQRSEFQGKIYFLTQENRIHIFKPRPYNFLLIIQTVKNHEKAESGVISIHSEDMENTPLMSWMKFCINVIMIGIFSSKRHVIIESITVTRQIFHQYSFGKV